MQCVADFIGNSFVERRLFASCLQQIKSYASRHRKAFRRKHFFSIIHHHHHHHHEIIDSTRQDHHLDNFNLIHLIINLNHAPHTVHLICILLNSFIILIIKQLSLHLRFASRDYFQNSPLSVS